MNWKENLEKFNLPHSKMLYMIYYFFKTGKLDFEQKYKLKGIFFNQLNRICYHGI